MGCYPCPVTNKIIKQLETETYGKSKLAVVKFPTNFPAPNDLFYLAAKEICDFRMSYYNVFYAPTIIIDGMIKPVASDSNSIKAAIDSRLSVTPIFSVNVSSTLEGDYSAVYEEGFQAGQKSKLAENNEKFYNGIEKWLVPAIITVIALGGFVTIASIKFIFLKMKNFTL